MKNTKEALIWIVTILQKHKIPFQITGGLAAKVYGSTRELSDIDIDIPEECFVKILDEVSPYIIFGPAQFKNEYWDLLRMTLNYKEQDIDLTGAYEAKIYRTQDKAWTMQSTDFSKSNYANIYDMKLPVVTREELVTYKKILARYVDLLDLKFLEQ